MNIRYKALRYVILLSAFFKISAIYLFYNAESDNYSNEYNFNKIEYMETSKFTGYKIDKFCMHNVKRILGVTTEDFNNDGYKDFAISYEVSPNYHLISIFYNNENLSFVKKDVYLFNYSDISDLDAADYDNDGDIDFIFCYSEYEWYDGISYRMNGTINLLRNNGSNDFENITMISKRCSSIPADPEGGRINFQIFSIDYDQDGDIDLLVGDNSGAIELYLNRGNGSFDTAGILNDFGVLSWGICSGDFDNDKDIDYAVVAEENSSLGNGHYYIVWNENVNDVIRNETIEIIGDCKSGTASIIPIDYDCDNDIDFISGNMGSLNLIINENMSYDFQSIMNIPFSSPDLDSFIRGVLASADFNNDGYEDFIAGGENGILRLFINNGKN